MTAPTLKRAFLLAATAAVIMFPRPSFAQDAGAAGPVCSAADARCVGPDKLQADLDVPRWYVILRERVEAFCDFYLQAQADAKYKGAPFNMPSAGAPFYVYSDPNHRYVYSPDEVQALLKHCGAYANMLRKHWEDTHPGQKAPY